MSGAGVAEHLRIADGDLDISISRLGGAIRSAEFRGIPFLVPAGGPDGGMASFPLVPFGNRVEYNVMTVEGRDHPFCANTTDPLYLHGDGWLGVWDVTDSDETHVELAYSHEAGRGSPYRYSASQRFSVSGGRLQNTLSVTNAGEAPMPFGLGFHPFFALSSQAILSSPATHFWTERDGHLPDERVAIPEIVDFSRPAAIPQQWINNAFEGWNGKASILWPEKLLRADIDADPVFGNYMIYRPDGDATFFCFEPMSHLPNGHHMPDFGGLVLLQPGASLAGQMTIGLSAVEI